jgi:hypothetical protein
MSELTYSTNYSPQSIHEKYNYTCVPTIPVYAGWMYQTRGGKHGSRCS